MNKKRTFGCRERLKPGEGQNQDAALWEQLLTLPTPPALRSGGPENPGWEGGWDAGEGESPG